MTADETLLTTDEVSEMLRISPRTIEKWVRQRRIPYLKVGRCVRFYRADVIKWLDKRFVKAGPFA